MKKDKVSLEKGLIKNKRPFAMHFKNIKQKLFAGILATSIMIGIGFSFIACGEKPEPEPTPPVVDTTPTDPTPDPTPDDPVVTPEPEPEPEPEPPVYEGPTTMEEFYENYNEKALEFIKETLKPHIAEDHDILAYGYEIDSYSGKIKAVKARFIKYEDTERTIGLDKLVFNQQVSIEDAFTGNCTSDNLEGTYTCDEYITFDYRMNYMEQDIIESLMQACGVTGGQNFYSEIYSINNDERSFLLGHVDPATNKVDIYNVVIYKRFESTLEEALKNPYSKRLTKVSPMGEYDFQIKQYTQETNVLPETFEELTISCDKIMYEGLKGSFLAEIGNRFFKNYRSENIINSSWKIIRQNDKITCFQVELNYEDGTDNNLYRLFNISCASPINYSDFAVENSKEILDNIAKNSTMSMETSFSYKISKQGSTPSYAYNLGEKILGYESGKYYYKIESYTFNSDQWGEAQRLQIMKITKNEVKTATIVIKVGETEEKYEQNVENGYYTVFEKTNASLIDGDKIFFAEESEVEAELE